MSIASENVTMMLSVVDTELWLSAVVETEDTVGAVVSVLVVVLSDVLESYVVFFYSVISYTATHRHSDYYQKQHIHNSSVCNIFY